MAIVEKVQPKWDLTKYQCAMYTELPKSIKKMSHNLKNLRHFRCNHCSNYLENRCEFSKKYIRKMRTKYNIKFFLCSNCYRSLSFHRFLFDYEIQDRLCFDCENAQKEGTLASVLKLEKKGIKYFMEFMTAFSAILLLSGFITSIFTRHTTGLVGSTWESIFVIYQTAPWLFLLSFGVTCLIQYIALYRLKKAKKPKEKKIIEKLLE